MCEAKLGHLAEAETALADYRRLWGEANPKATSPPPLLAEAEAVLREASERAGAGRPPRRPRIVRGAEAGPPPGPPDEEAHAAIPVAEGRPPIADDPSGRGRPRQAAGDLVPLGSESIGGRRHPRPVTPTDSGDPRAIGLARVVTTPADRAPGIGNSLRRGGSKVGQRWVKTGVRAVVGAVAPLRGSSRPDYVPVTSHPLTSYPAKAWIPTHPSTRWVGIPAPRSGGRSGRGRR